MNKFFVENGAVAKSLDSAAKEAVEYVYMCCPSCDEGPLAIVDGWLVSTHVSAERVASTLIKAGDPREKWVILQSLKTEFAYEK